MTDILPATFRGCNKLINISIPESVNRIGSEAFKNCESLKEITLPNGIEYLARQTFDGCSSLTSVMLPESLTSISGGVFFKCSSLTSITIPKNVTSIGDDNFEYCDALKEITCLPVTPPSFPSGCYLYLGPGLNLDKILVPFSALEAYKSAFGWSEYADIIQAMPE